MNKPIFSILFIILSIRIKSQIQVCDYYAPELDVNNCQMNETEKACK